ncbi:MAG: diguanylate cyclase [Pseudohongiellaceae bacterium]
MPLQLDTVTLVLMFITIGITTSVMMFLIWRINRELPGVLFWMVAAILNTATAVASLLTALFAWGGGWGPFLNTTLSLVANMLVLEGALRFRGYDSRRREQLFLALIPLFLLVTWFYRFDPTARGVFHDSIAMTFQIAAGVVMIWRTASPEERRANLLAAFGTIAIGLTIAWRLALALSGSALNGLGPDSPTNQWYLFAGANFHIAWIVGLSVACYYRSRQQVMALAREDALTALPNRRWIDEKLAETLIEAQRSGEHFAVIMLDINDFKKINDQHGHSTGDRVLVQFADRLRQAVREADFAGRLAGDEFLILARRIDTQERLVQLVERIRHQLNETIALSEHEIDIRVSIGIALFPNDGDGPDQLLGTADAAIYRDKRRQSSSAGDPARTYRAPTTASPGFRD